MRNFFGSVKFKVFVIIACILIGLMLRTASTGGLPTVTQNIVSVVISPFQKASSYVSDAFSGLIDNVVNLGTLKTENDKLKKQVIGLQKQIVDCDEVKRKYERLKVLEDIQDQGNHCKYLTAAVISHDSGQWFSAFTIDEGSVNGVKVNDPVITAEGLVGVVVTTNLNTSVVSTVLDPSMHIGSTVSKTGDTGISQGDSELYAKGEFKLTDLDKSSNATVGDIIITTGKTGMYPKNIIIGTVQTIEQDSSGSSLIAICKPMVDPSSVKDVLIVTTFSGKAADTAPASAATKGGK